jgi:formylglycine-generating enzyme required for sulfatase activity
VDGGLVMIESVEGKLARVFRPTNELAGTFSEIAEGQRSRSGLHYVWIPPGEFWMGAIRGGTDAEPDEGPRHRVRITKGFWMGDTPVTVVAYARFPGSQNPAAKPDHPIVDVTWDQAKAYCEWDAGRLPTEAEWEYAARGGKDGLKYPWGNDITPDNANYSGSKWHGTSPVHTYPPNAWGLYDMAGNVWEWVADWYDKDYYASSPADDPRGPQSGALRVLRGGSFVDVARFLRASGRFRVAPGGRSLNIGFRCVREVVP